MLHLNLFDTLLANLWMNKLLLQPSRGGLEVESSTDNSLHSDSVGSNPAWVWYMDRSEVETLLSHFKLQGAGGSNAFTI